MAVKKEKPGKKSGKNGKAKKLKPTGKSTRAERLLELERGKRLVESGAALVSELELSDAEQFELPHFIKSDTFRNFREALKSSGVVFLERAVKDEPLLMDIAWSPQQLAEEIGVSIDKIRAWLAESEYTKVGNAWVIDGPMIRAMKSEAAWPEAQWPEGA